MKLNDLKRYVKTSREYLESSLFNEEEKIRRLIKGTKSKAKLEFLYKAEKEFNYIKHFVYLLNRGMLNQIFLNLMFTGYRPNMNYNKFQSDLCRWVELNRRNYEFKKVYKNGYK